METVSLEILRNYILSKGGSVTSQEVVREFQPFLKDPVNKEKNKGLFKSYLSTLTEYRQDAGSTVKILELKKAFRSDAYHTPTKENHPANKVYKDQLQPMRERHQYQRDTQRDILRNRATTESAARSRAEPRSGPESAARSRAEPRSVTESVRGRTESRQAAPPATVEPAAGEAEARSTSSTSEEQDTVPSAVVTPTRVDKPVIRKASINAINMFNRTAAQQKQRPVAPIVTKQASNTSEGKADTLDSQADELREEMESGCSNVTLEQSEKEWIIKTSQGDVDAITRLLLTDRKLVEFRDFITGYTGLHWACKLGRVDMARVLLQGGSAVNTASHSGQTPLHLAAQTGCSEIIELLLRYDADKDQRDYRGRKAGHYLSESADSQAKSLLSLPQPLSVPVGNRKASKATTLGGDGFAENTPKRSHTINQAWKKLKGPGFKSSFVSKKSKKETTHSQKTSDKLTSPRTNTKENRQSQTLPARTPLYF